MSPSLSFRCENTSCLALLVVRAAGTQFVECALCPWDYLVFVALAARPRSVTVLEVYARSGADTPDDEV